MNISVGRFGGHDQIQCCFFGNREKAIEIHNKLLPMLNHIRQNVEQIISFEKRILKKRGIISSDYCRKPSYNTDECFDKLFEEFYAEMSERYGW